MNLTQQIAKLTLAQVCRAGLKRGVLVPYNVSLVVVGVQRVLWSEVHQQQYYATKCVRIPNLFMAQGYFISLQ